MTKSEIADQVIQCIKENYEDVGEAAPDVTGDTRIMLDVEGMDSLRAIEVLVTLEDKLNCDFPPEKVFLRVPAGSDQVSDIATAISALLAES